MASWMPTTYGFSSNFKYHSMQTQHQALFSFRSKTAKIGPDLSIYCQKLFSSNVGATYSLHICCQNLETVNYYSYNTTSQEANVKSSVSRVRLSSLCKGPGACFSKVPIINGPGKLSPFSLKIEVSIVLHVT